jgi:hypothetical protein
VFDGSGALDAKTEELIALAMAVSKNVAILMNGGPSTVHAPREFEAFDEDADK